MATDRRQTPDRRSEPRGSDRRGRYAVITIDMMRAETGHDLYANQFATLAGFSTDKVQDLCKCGLIAAVREYAAVSDARERAAARFRWRIPFAEAQRWLRELRLL